MASLGDLSAALTSIRPANTNALLNATVELNIFTKRFVQPPPEYASIGQHLAPGWLQEAQNGNRHSIARKLGLLFKGREVLPSTLELIKAYGSRASEIAGNSVANPQGSETHGAFADMIGADATTLWAAATSGRAAIQCHLLACLLARIWTYSEATSIWVELVTRRKEALRRQLAEEGELDQEVLLATGEELSREHLRDWDASARAWLRVADLVMAKQQRSFDSSSTIWTNLSTHETRHSAKVIFCSVLCLGIYPDMKYLSAKEQNINQRDPLFKDRGILSLGLGPSPRMVKERRSIYWALPLAHLRYYGRLPVTKMRSFRTSEQDRITVDEMLLAMISAYLLPWDDGSVSTEEVLQFASNSAMELHRAWHSNIQQRATGHHKPQSETVRPNGFHPGSWLTMLSRICVQYKTRLHDQRVRKIQNMGRHFCTAFQGIPFQNILNVSTYLQAARSQENKIGLLRHIAAALSAQTPGRLKYFEGFEYATALPEPNSSNAESSPPGMVRSSPRHERWLAFDPFDIGEHAITSGLFGNKQDLGGLRLTKAQRFILTVLEGEGIQETISANTKANSTLSNRLDRIEQLGEQALYPSASSPYFERHESVEESYLHRDVPGYSGDVVIVHNHSTRDGRRRRDGESHIPGFVPAISIVMKTRLGVSRSVVNYDVVHGDLDSIALLCRSARGPQLMELFKADSIDFGRCAKELMLDASHNASFLGMTFVEQLYQSMAGATIDVRAVQMDLGKALWLEAAIESAGSKHTLPAVVHATRSIPRIELRGVDVATCFACIAMMESGSYNVSPAELQNVFALCAAESLYVASTLLRDPAADAALPKVQRFTGNIGKAGMVFMVPPKQPEIRSYDRIDEWYQYDHAEFNGMMGSCFEGTSLHLSFSEASQAVNVDFSGGRDTEAYFLETLVSVHDKGTWIAELDVLGTMQSAGLIRRFIGYSACECSSKTAAPASSLKIISIPNFAEMIVPPRQPGIIRARENWQARLAATSLCLAKGYKVLLKPEQICWGCFSTKSVDGVTIHSVVRQQGGVVAVL
ncbi:Uu.00g063770.m01.CDS01 [Anthostomella pinea]|uniref:Uu.00g063770.m01.CDS01 n=1 Tax=Anthostomella pinea TaxID=933095 RepID=A0AAI8VTE0_9PEZI|nr:Uu.00g063770.m01.CDS01 [Anthostomella pinea]